MSKRELLCTLTEPVFTSDGDFIPTGTPVRVMNVIEHEVKSPFDGVDPRIDRRITVRTAAYAFAGPVGEEPNVWCGLEFEVEPHLLVWLDCGNAEDTKHHMDHFDGGRNEKAS